MAKHGDRSASAEADEAKAATERDPGAKLPAKPTASAAPRFRVWPFGDLHYGSSVFKPGEELPISEEEAEAIGPTAERIADKTEA